MSIFSNLVRKLAPKIVSNQPKETFFYWVNIQFNVVDKERRDRIGPDLSCAEWILRNGGSVKWKKGVITDFNELPQNSKDFRLQEIDASDTNIMLEGFEHFRNCKYIEKLKLHKCYYINDEALKHLDILSESLKHLTISECNNVTDAGIKGLQALHNLRVLILIKLAGVQRMNETAKALQGALTNCKIEF